MSAYHQQSKKNQRSSSSLSVPGEVADALHNTPDATDSISLRMNKYVRGGEGLKLNEWSAICKCAKNNACKVSPMEIPGAKSFTAVLRGRMMVDHSGVLLNASLNLHRFFGYPVIPGSALKGISRQAAKLAVDAGELRWEDWQRIWGNEPGSNGKDKGQLQAGTVAFLAAEPTNDQWKLVVDILNYHQDCDYENPNPVFFPAVERGAKFTFTIFPLRKKYAKPEDSDIALEYLQKALKENGVGAKTAAGYGWFGEFQWDKQL